MRFSILSLFVAATAVAVSANPIVEKRQCSGGPFSDVR